MTEEKQKNRDNQQTKKGITRRSFIKGGAALGGATLFTSHMEDIILTGFEHIGEQKPHGVGKDYKDYTAENVIYTLCEQCNTHCTVKAVIGDGDANDSYSCMVRKIAGNPYSPLSMQPHGQIDYDTDPKEAAKPKKDFAKTSRSDRGGRTCLKGQAGIQTAFDAYRVQSPLKRVGPRGSGEWKEISWEQAIDEIVNGSDDLENPGLKSMTGYAPKGKVMSDWEKVQNGEMTQEEFDEKYEDDLIDTKHPDFGPKTNQIVNVAGDRRAFILGRFGGQMLGTVNNVHHGGICGVNGVMGNIRSFNKKKKRMYADVENSDFVIIWGTDPFVANKGPSWLAPQYANALERGMKLATVDPRMSKAAEKSDIWVAPKPGTDGALAFGMARWIMENERYDKNYLTNPNEEVANRYDETTWSDATHLVKVDEEAKPKLKAKDLGIGGDEFVVLKNGRAVPHTKANKGQLEVDTVINGIHVKSSYTMFKDRVMEKTLEEYAEICEVKPEDIIELAKEFTSYGKRAAITSYRGPAMHTNGFQNLRAINCLNHLIGNYDWKGGSITTGVKYKRFNGSRYNAVKVPGGHQSWGIRLDRTNAKYEGSTLFEEEGYPAKRRWAPLSAHGIQEVLPSAADGYPYPIKALFFHRLSPILSVPGGNHHKEILKDPDIIPLVVSSDISIGESSYYADYILPDKTYLERWGTESTYPNYKYKLSHFQQPVTDVFPNTQQYEDTLIDIAKEMGLPGAGKNGFADGSSLDKASDFYLKLVANTAYDDEPVPDADDEELKLFEKTRKKALGDSFDINQWKSAVKPEEWRKVVYVLNRGGRYEGQGSEYEGEHIKYKQASLVFFYNDFVSKFKDSYSGEHYDGLPKVEPIKFYNGKEVKDESYPLHIINWKANHISCHRTIADSWLREIRNENFVWINPVDAKKRGVKSKDKVKIKSPNFEVEGRVIVTEGIKPGVIGSNYNYGHYAFGSQSMVINGKNRSGVESYGHNEWLSEKTDTGYAPGRGTGFNFNDLQRLDDSLSNDGCMCDPIAGSASQYDTKVELEKI